MNGMVEECVQHFVNAVKASGSPSQIMRILAESLPPQVFTRIVQRLDAETGGADTSRRNLSTVSSPSEGPGGSDTEGRFKDAMSTGPTVTLMDDDLDQVLLRI